MKHTVLFTGHIIGRAVLEVTLDWPEPVNGTNTAALVKNVHRSVCCAGDCRKQNCDRIPKQPSA